MLNRLLQEIVLLEKHRILYIGDEVNFKYFIYFYLKVNFL
jgi:hypothetical protein